MRMYLQGQTLNEQFAKPGHIVVATDLGDLDFLLPYAIAQAKICGANLTLAHAVTGGDSKVPFGAEHPGQFERQAQELDTAMRKVKAEGVNCTSQIAHALLPDEFLHHVVRETGAQRVIMASHGRGNFGQVTLGSVAHQLLSTLKVPVFVVGPKSYSQSQHCYPRRILHPVSFSGGYSDSVEFARNIAQLHNAELMLMHVLDPDLPEEVDPARTVQWAKNALDAAIPDRTTVAVPLLTHVACGNIVKEILKTAATFNADWIVFGTTPSSYAPLLASSAAYKIMATLDIPVLTFPHRVRSIAAELEEMEMPAQVGRSETEYCDPRHKDSVPRAQQIARGASETHEYRRSAMVRIHNTTAEHFAKPEDIIVATDLNDLDLLLPHAICQAKTYGARLTFIHSLSPHGIIANEAGTGREECAAQEQMDVLLSRVEAEGVSCNSEIAYAFSPEDALSQAARRFPRGRLIMATHGRGRLSQIMLGSVARELLAFLDIPIFAVGPNVGSQASYCNPKRIVHPLSFSSDQGATVEFALKLAEVHGAELILMHVCEPGAGDEIEPDGIRRLMEETGLVFSIPTHTHIAYGNVVEEIINTARLFGADWLILGTSPIAAAPMSYTPFSATNKAYRLMAAANIPVLTFPHRTHSINPSGSKDNAAVANTHA